MKKNKAYGGGRQMESNGVPQEKHILARIGACDFLRAPQAAGGTLEALARDPALRYVVCGAEKDRRAQPPAAQLARFLLARFDAGLPGVTALACTDSPHNGPRLLEETLQASLALRPDGAFVQWLMGQNAFRSTLFERVPASPALADGFSRWVIEAPEGARADFPADAALCPVAFSADIEPLRARKTRLLDGALAALAPGAFLAGLDTLSQCMREESARAFLAHTLADELVPFVPGEKSEALAYAASLCQRLEKEEYPCRLSDALQGALSRYAACALPALLDYARAKSALPPCLCFGLSALIMLYAGARADESGAYYVLREGERYAVTESAYALSAFSRMNCDMPPESLAYAVLSDYELWHADLRAVPVLEDAVAGQLRDIQLLGAKQALRTAWEEHERR